MQQAFYTVYNYSFKMDNQMEMATIYKVQRSLLPYSLYYHNIIHKHLYIYSFYYLYKKKERFEEK